MVVMSGLIVAGCSGDDPLTSDDDEFVETLLKRVDWFWASVPVHGQDEAYVIETGDARQFDVADRVETIRWFLPINRVLAEHLNPNLVGEARDETVPAMELFFRADDFEWAEEDWAGIMTGRVPADMSPSSLDHFEIWINDGEPVLENRSGTRYSSGTVSSSPAPST